MRAAIHRFGDRLGAISLLAGVLLGLSFPPFPFPLLSLAGFLLVFHIIDRSDSARQAAFYSYLSFLVWNLIVTYWLMMADVTAGVAAILANAAVMTIPVMLQKKTARHINSPLAAGLLQTCWWVGFEYLHHQWDLAWPWLTVGNAWANLPQLVQYISATGYLGISFWVVGSAALGYQYLVHRHRTTGWAALVLLLVLPAVSLLQWTIRTPVSNGTLQMVVAQPNFDSYVDYGGYDSPFQSVQQLIQLTDAQVTDSTDLVLWPENGIHPRLESTSASGSVAYRVNNLLRRNAVRWDALVIGGSTYYEYFTGPDTPALPMSSGENRFLAFNAAVAFHPDRSRKVYRKHNLVPIVERMPFVHFLDAIDRFGWIDWSAVQGYGKGGEATLFRAGPTHVPALICYDSVFPGWVREFVRSGAGVITVITNDGWWGDTGGHEQHFAYARLRAVAFQRYVVRSANNGISGVIAPDGTVLKRTEYWTQDAFRFDIPVIEQQTLYTRFGDWLPLLSLLSAAVGLAIGRFSRTGSKRSR